MTIEGGDQLLAQPGFSEAVLDTIGAIVLVTDSSGAIVYANRACQELMSYSPEELKGQTWDRFVVPEEADSVRGVFLALTAGDFPNTHENDWLTRDGERRRINWSNTALLGPDGGVQYVIATGTDVTEQRRSENALRDIEERFRELTESVREVFFVRDLDDRRKLYVSPAYEAIWGRPVQALYDDPDDFLKAVHPDDLDRVRQSLSGQTPERMFDDEYRIVRPDGTIRWVRARTFPVRNEAGEFHRVVGIAEDVTDRKQAEAAAMESEALLRQIVDLVPHMIFVKDGDGRFLLVNQAKAAAYGMTVEQMTGARQQGLVGGATPSARMLAADREVIASGAAKFIPEEDFVDAAGKRRVLETIKMPFSMPGVNEPAVLGVATDITARKQAELALLQEEQRYRVVVSALAEGIAMIDADGRISTCNDSAAQILGREADDLIGRYWFQSKLKRVREDGSPFPDDEHPIANALRTGEPFSDVVMGLVQPDETIHWVSINSRPKFREGRRDPYAVVVSLRDITRQVRAEAALRTSEDRLRRSQICANIGTYDLELQTGRLHWSERVAPMLGYAQPLTETTLDALVDAMHPDDVPVVKDAIQACVEGREKYLVEYRVVWPDGTLRWMRSQGDVVRDREGVPVRLLGAVQDITDEKRSEQALRASEEKYRALMENASDAIFICGLDGKILDANKRAETTFGYSKAELLRLYAKDIHPPEERDALRAAFRDIVEEGSSLYEHLILRKDGSTAPTEVAGTLFEFGDRQVALGIFRDLSERKQAELAQAKLSQALEQTADSVMITDADGIIEYVNPQFELVTGYPAAEAIGQTPRIFNSGELGEDFYADLWATLRRGEVFRAVFPNRRKDGSLFYEDKAISPLRDDSGHVSHFISVSRDVTADLAAEQERLKHEQVHRDALVREVHHRIKNHLQGLSGLLRQHAIERPALREPLETVIAQIHSVAVVHGLQGGAGHGEVRLCEMTEAICRAARAIAGEECGLDLSLEMTVPVRLAPEEAVSIALVLNEMLINAVKHGDRSSGPVLVKVQGDADQGSVTVVNPLRREQVWTAFREDAGSGTGLHLVRALLPRVGAEFNMDVNAEGKMEACLVLSSPVTVGAVNRG